MATALAEQLRQTHILLASSIENIKQAQPQTPQEKILQDNIVGQFLAARDVLVSETPQYRQTSFPPPRVQPKTQPRAIIPIEIPKSAERQPEQKQAIDRSLLLSIFEGHEELIPQDQEGQLYLSMVAKTRKSMANEDPREVRKQIELFTKTFAEKGIALRERFGKQLSIIYKKYPLSNQPPPATGLARGEIAIGEVWDSSHP